MHRRAGRPTGAPAAQEFAIPPWLSALVACAGWPRYAHLPADTAVAIPAGSEPPPPEVSWQRAASAPATQPYTAAPEALDPWRGLLWQGSLHGAGLVQEPAADTACGGASEFPPAELGAAYAGESHWFLPRPRARGTLCALAESPSSELRMDLLLYYLDDCGAPRGPETDPDSGLVLGLGGGSSVAWSAPVVADSPLAVVLSGSAPDAPDADFAYAVGLSLVAPGSEADCPDLPGDVP